MDAGTKGHEDDEGKRVEDTRDDDGGEAIEERTSSESDDSETAEENDSRPFTRRMSTVLSTGKKVRTRRRSRALFLFSILYASSLPRRS